LRSANKSRRQAQRRKKRYAKRKDLQRLSENQIKVALARTVRNCRTIYGFCADPSLSLHQNFRKAINTQPPRDFLQPQNLKFHSLCTENHLPLGSKELLGLNLKFCLASQQVKNNINKTILRLARSIRTKYYLAEHNLLNESDYNKQIYKKNQTWQPPPAPLYIEDKITEFEKALKSFQQKIINKNRHQRHSNLTPLQSEALKKLRNNRNITIKPTDKNLGPAVMDTATYIHQVLTEHLLTDAYLQLTQLEAKNRMEDVKISLKELLLIHSDKLSTAELTYFKRSLQAYHRTPIFYGLPKVHKSPVTLRPVVSTSGSLLAVFSTWLDFKMKTLLPFVQSHIQNSFTVVEELKAITLPKNALIFTADATSMYTNIDTATGLASVRAFIDSNIDNIPNDFPVDLFLRVLECVMTNNVFTFIDTYWLQLTGTAMGTPVACAYAMVTFGHHENSVILKNFNNELLYYRRYIDDIFGIWVHHEPSANSSWNSFKSSLNNWGNLKWKIEEPTTKTIFLDLEIQIEGSTLSTKTYQKDMNLYLYIPPLSAHPPSCFKGLIAGELRRYWLQNNHKDFKSLLRKFIDRLLDRGHTLDNIIPIFTQAATSLDRNVLCHKPTNKASGENLFIHREFHPKDIQRRDIRILYQEILEPHLNFDKMIVAMSRPKNLRDILSKSTTVPPPNFNIQTVIRNLKTTQFALEP